MEQKPYLIVIDTVEATTLQTVARGLGNVHVIMASSSVEAKQTLLRVFTPFVRNQIMNSLYCYDLKDMTENLKKLQDAQMLPLFSHLPLAGGRPPKPADDSPSLSLGNQTLEQNVNKAPQPPLQPLVQQPTVQVNNLVANNGRSREFQDVERGMPETKNTLTAEQADLVARVGAIPSFNGAEEGNQPRINAAVGGMNDLRPQPTRSSAPGSLSAEQAEILARLGASHTGPGVIEEAQDENSTIIEDPSLTQVDDRIMTEEDIKRLEEEIKGV